MGRQEELVILIEQQHGEMQKPAHWQVQSTAPEAEGGRAGGRDQE